METMTLMPRAAAATSDRRAAVSYVPMPMAHGVVPFTSACAHLGCDWSLATIATGDRQANTKAVKAFATRRLGETST